jgi:glycerol-3-phosphate O-acyltransferase
MSADLAKLLADEVPSVLLIQASTPAEARLIREAVAAAGGSDVPVVFVRALSGASVLEGDPAVRLIPLRVAWLPGRAARLTDLMPGRDPYHPVWARHRSRATVLAGEPATVGELRQRWQEATDGEDFPAFVARRATLALDRAEYQLRGPRYRTPSLVKEEILASRRFRSGLPAGSNLDQASRILDELVAGWSRRLIDVMPTVGRMIYQRGFDPRIDYDETQVERLRNAMQRNPAILLWSHRSNLDTLVLAAALQEKGLPPAHLFAGINMAFGPMGAILRRAGVIFIRRSIGDDALYRYVLREYVGYVLEKRFNLSWSIEGGRSRTGKMLPPRLGLLSYAAEAYKQGRVDDVLLLPVSITFDQLHEIAEYAEYARGAAKRPEGFGWLYGFIKAYGSRQYGKVYLRFGEPVSLSSFVDPSQDEAAQRLGLAKAAFEVAWRVNQDMPVTATAAMTTILLAMHGAALTFGQIRLGLTDALTYLDSRDIPRTASLRALAAPGAARATLDALVAGGLVTVSAGGREPVWMIEPDQQLAATFYRNSLVHFLLDTALCELAVLRAGEGPGDPVEAFWGAIAELRDLLKFEFYFREREEHLAGIAAEMARHDPGWEGLLRSGPDGVDTLLGRMRPLVSHVVVRPFVEAYRLVADVLASDAGLVDEKEVIQRALGLGEQYVAQRRLRSSESVSVLLFQTALQLAGNRGLVTAEAEGMLGAGGGSGAARSGGVAEAGGGFGVGVRREAFLEGLRGWLRRLDLIEDRAIRRYVDDARIG